MNSAFADTVEYPAGSVHPVVSGVIAILLVVALVFLALRNWLGAVVAGVGLVVAVVIAILQRATHASEPSGVTGPLGRGPYRKHDCSTYETVVETLARMADELRDVPKARGWDIDTAPFEDDCQRAAAASNEGDYSNAFREYYVAIRMMKQVRQQQMSESSDSNIL